MGHEDALPDERALDEGATGGQAAASLPHLAHFGLITDVSLVHGASALDIWKERPMRMSIEIKFRVWGWRLSITLSRR
jgi:hypothetical protein